MDVVASSVLEAGRPRSVPTHVVVFPWVLLPAVHTLVLQKNKTVPWDLSKGR